jgi:hypothetical protein
LRITRKAELSRRCESPLSTLERWHNVTAITVKEKHMHPDIFVFNLHNTSEEVTAKISAEPEIYNRYILGNHSGEKSPAHRIILVVLQSETPTDWTHRMIRKYGHALKMTHVKRLIEQ